MSGPRRSSGSWRERQERDPYVRDARREGWRSRAVYKLKQIDERERLLRPGSTCVDLGAAPGGWSQYAAARLDGAGRVIALDILPMESLPGVEFLLGDFTQDGVLLALEGMLAEGRVDLVMSDMAPNMSGNRGVDQPRAMYLAELALDFARRFLKPGGTFLCKLFQGEGFDAFVADARRSFERIKLEKPRASRSGNREVYLVARNYRL